MSIRAMKNLLLPLLFLTLTGCVCLNPEHKKPAPPIANTGEVINSLEKTQEELVKAGESNTIVGDKVEKALSLADRLQKLLEQIEEQSNSKLVKEPIK